MKFVIDTKNADSVSMKLDKLLYLISVYLSNPIDNFIVKNLQYNGYLVYDLIDSTGRIVNARLTQKGVDAVEEFLLNNEYKITNNEDNNFTELAQKLIDIFPNCKKPGTNYYFRGNVKDIALKLKRFFKIYGSTYTNEQIINATKKYVESFNGNYAYMRLLKYFIWKQVDKIDSEGNGYHEEVSELADYINNASANEITNNNDWTANLL